MTGPEACVVAAIHHADPALTVAGRALRSAAADTGWDHILHVVAVSAPGQGDQFLYYATRSEAIQAASEVAATSGGQVLHIDLLVFRPRGESR